MAGNHPRNSCKHTPENTIDAHQSQVTLRLTSTVGFPARSSIRLIGHKNEKQIAR